MELKIGLKFKKYYNDNNINNIDYYFDIFNDYVIINVRYTTIKDELSKNRKELIEKLDENKKYHMSNEIKNKINDALYNFYLEADKYIIKDSQKSDIQNLEEYNKKKKQIIFLAQAKAKQKHNEYLLALANKFQEAVLQNFK